MEDDLPNDVDELKRIVQKAKKAVEDAVAAKKAAEDAVEAEKARADTAEKALAELRCKHWMAERTALMQTSVPCGMTWRLTRIRW